MLCAFVTYSIKYLLLLLLQQRVCGLCVCVLDMCVRLLCLHPVNSARI